MNGAQKNYAQIQKEALSIVFALSKFHHYLYGRKFILVTDHKPLLSLFGPSSDTPKPSDTVGSYVKSIQLYDRYQHGNANALSRLPVGPDDDFDGDEMDNNADTVRSGIKYICICI